MSIVGKADFGRGTYGKSGGMREAKTDRSYKSYRVGTSYVQSHCCFSAKPDKSYRTDRTDKVRDQRCELLHRLIVAHSSKLEVEYIT